MITMLLKSAARILHHMYEKSRSREHLNLAITTRRHAVSCVPDGDPSHHDDLHKLGALLYLRYESHGDIEDLQEAVSAFGQVLELLPENNANEAAAFTNIGALLQVRFQRLGNVEDLEQAVMMQARAVDLTPDGHPDKPMYLNSLGIVLQEKFQRFGSIDDLKQSVVMLTRAIDLTPDGHPDKPRQLNNLGGVLQKRFQRLGGMDDLEQAVVMVTHAVDLTPDGHPDKRGRLSNLGDVLWERFKRLGGMDDLERSVVMLTRAVDLTPDGHPNKPERLNNLGNVLHERFRRLGGTDDVEQAVAMRTRAIDLTPDGHPDKPMYLNNLGGVFHARFERLRNMDDLEQAVVMQIHAVDLTPDGHPNKPSRLRNLGIVLRERFQRLGDTDDLERAVVISTHAVDLVPNGHSRRTLYLRNMASILYARYQSSYKQPTDLTRAITASTEAATENSGNPSERLRAAILTTDLLLHDPNLGSHDALMQAHERVLNLVPQVVWLGHNIQRRYEELANLGTLVNRAATVAITAGEYSQAVEWLESGRTIVWSQLLHLRTPLDKLRERDPKLASELEQVSRALEHASTSSDKVANFIGVSTSSSPENNSKHPERSLSQEAKSHYGLAIEYDRLIKQIRSLDGFENFLCPKPFSELVPACKSGPIVIVNVHKSRCDALILLPPGKIVHVPLPQFSHDIATVLFQQLTQVLGQNNLLNRLRENTTDGLDRAMKKPKSTRDSREVLFKILADLWKLVVKPIVDMVTAIVSIVPNLLIPWLFT
jgi:tetratricopeptide (TPR) repeat protein